MINANRTYNCPRPPTSSYYILFEQNLQVADFWSDKLRQIWLYLINHGFLNRWTDIFILPRPTWVETFNPNNAQCYTNSLNLCKTLRKSFFRHAKGKSMVNIYIFNALGQNLANSESCPTRSLLL